MIPTKKNIAILHPYANREGGAIKMMILLAGRLASCNHIIFHTLVHDKTIFPNEASSFSWKSYSNSFFGKYISFLLIAFHIRNDDFIIIGNSPMHFVGIISKVLFFSKAKIIWWHHHYPWYYTKNTNVFTRLKRYVEKKCMKKIDRVLANSLYLQSSIKKLWNIDSYILYPILGEDYVKKEISYGERKSTLLAYGRWEKGKNIHLVFQTYERLKRKVPNLTLTVGGEGQELDKYKDHYRGVRNVKIVGRLTSSQVISQLCKTQLLLFPSYIDSFGLVKLEGMSLGVPVLSFQGLHKEELVQNGKNGFCAESEEDFYQKAYEILTNSKLRKTLSLGALETSRCYGLSTFDSQLDDIFRF